jgi:hypothetical protein
MMFNCGALYIRFTHGLPTDRLNFRRWIGLQDQGVVKNDGSFGGKMEGKDVLG